MPESVLGGELLTLRQVADMVKVHLATCYRWILRGKLRAYRRGGRWVVSRNDLQNFLEPIDPRQPPPPAKPAKAESRAAEEARRKWVEEQLVKWRLV